MLRLLNRLLDPVLDPFFDFWFGNHIPKSLKSK